MLPDFWRHKKVLITGHTGFKGSWLTLWLKQQGAIVAGYALPPDTEPNLYHAAKVGDGIDSLFGDIRDRQRLHDYVQKIQPEIVFHLAAKPLVRFSYQYPVDTFETNVMGTVNLLEEIRLCPSVRAAVIVTSDKCYQNNEWVWPYRETDHLGGKDPYSASKACAEIVTAAYRSSFFTKSNEPPFVATARAGNVIGGGDWAPDRIIPDFVRAFTAGKKLVIRYPNAVRPWQYVLNPLHGYLMLAEQLWTEGQDFASAWNFGPAPEDHRPVRWIADAISRLWPSSGWVQDKQENHPESQGLALDSSRSRTLMHWRPTVGIEQCLQRTIRWYQAYYAGEDMHAYSLHELEQFITQ